MKISASIYSDKDRDLKSTIDDLKAHNIDLLHVDCNDDLSVFNDILQIRQWCNIPIDLHIITENPSKFIPYLEKIFVEYVTFQYENLKEKLELPSSIQSKKGIAVITPTPVSIFDQYPDFDFILIMATIPGQSGGVFDRVNFKKIRTFIQKHPSKSVHVDGGVNAEVSFILRNMGVNTAVSGSYLFKAPTVGQALLNLTNRNIESQFQLSDFMIPLEECPIISTSELSLPTILRVIEKGKLGFTLVIDEKHQLTGIISNADIRKGLLKQFDLSKEIPIQDFINRNPLKIEENKTVKDMLQRVQSCPFPVSYLPIVDNQNNARGIITFVHLVKGEI